MIDNQSIFNIPANYHFFHSLFSYLNEKFAKNISETTIFLPNRRSCRQLTEIFLQNNPNSFLPKIKAISDISYEDFFDIFPNHNIKDEIADLLEIEVLSGIDYLLYLAQEVRKNSNFGQNLSLNQAIKISAKLKSLFEEIESEQITLTDLEEIDDSNLSHHRQVTLEFLKEFYTQIKNSLIKRNTLFPLAYQNYLIEKLCNLLNQYNSKSPLVIAGSTGSVQFSKKLIKAIYSQKNGSVILYGSNDDYFEEENHPQYFLNQLINFLNITKNSVKNIEKEAFLLSDNDRQKTLSLLNLPAKETIKWQKISELLNEKLVRKDFEDNFQIIEAKHEIEEAQIIALKALENCNLDKTTAIISNNEALCNLIKLEFDKLSLFYNDTRNIGILDNKLIQFILQIVELSDNKFNSHSLLTLLKNPFCKYSKNHDLLNKFEIKILRKSRSLEGIVGIKDKVREEKELEEFFNKILSDLEEFDELQCSINISNQIKLIIKIAENLSNKNYLSLLSQEDAQIEIFDLFEKLKLQTEIESKPEDLFKNLQILLSQISYFKKSYSSAPIQILTTIEARLLNFDSIIIPSLNEGDFPEIEAENWLGKKIKKDLGINRTLKKIGQNSYDFSNYLSNKSVTLTRHKSKNDSPTIESPFLLKLKTIIEKLRVKINAGDKYFEILKSLNSPKVKEQKIANPKPQTSDRFNRVSITDISKLLANPYDIYAKRVLQLKKLDKIDVEPSYAEFGSFVHEALEKFVKNPQDDFIDNAKEIFQKYFINKDSEIVWWPKFEAIFKDFLKENEQFIDGQNFVEIPVKMEFCNKLITGKIDRVIFDEEGNAEIFDYKTGQVPSAKDVISGVNPQLTLSALLLSEGLIEAKLKNIDLSNFKALKYWKLSSSSISEIKKISDKNEEIQILISAAKSGLEKLFEYFDNEENGYIATEKNDKSDYRHLSRIFD